MKPLRVGVVGHWGGNIGHDFMALGAERLLAHALGRAEFYRIEHHHPLSIYPRGHPLRHARFLRHGRGGRRLQQAKRLLNLPPLARILWKTTWISKLDLAVVCGGPLIFPGVASGDLHLMFPHLFGAFTSQGVPLLNLSVGSAFPLERLSFDSLSQEDREFLKTVLTASSAVTVRDAVALRMVEALGGDAHFVPDIALMTGEMLETYAEGDNHDKYVVINYQFAGANTDWGQGVDPLRWEETMRALVSLLRSRHVIVFICHNDKELALAEALEPSFPRYRPRGLREYARILRGAVVGICSRIHAAVPLASLGIPVVGVGTDTRLGTLQALGLPCVYVKDATAPALEEMVEALISRRDMEHRRLCAIRQATLIQYTEIIRSVLRKAKV